jgi:hypothetical protein
MNTDTKKRARVHSLREWGRVKQKLCKQACKIFAFFCQSQIDGIIRAHLRNPWLVLLQPRPARGLLRSYNKKCDEQVKIRDEQARGAGMEGKINHGEHGEHGVENEVLQQMEVG